jgi:hypothetical protein
MRFVTQSEKTPEGEFYCVARKDVCGGPGGNYLHTKVFSQRMNTPHESNMDVDRRSVLAGIAAATVCGMSGCVSDETDSGPPAEVLSSSMEITGEEGAEQLSVVGEVEAKRDLDFVEIEVLFYDSEGVYVTSQFENTRSGLSEGETWRYKSDLCFIENQETPSEGAICDHLSGTDTFEVKVVETRP